jgi:tetratricopeptide (TPR) repeat protein
LVRAAKYRFAAATQVVRVGEPEVQVQLTLVPQGRGALRFEVQPEHVRVFLNGQSKGEAPLALTDLAPGKHEVRLEADWSLPWQGSVEVVAGQEVLVKRALDSKTEAYLLSAIERDPGRIVNYYDLGHLYARLQRFDDAFKAFAKGFDACTGPDISTNEMRRIYDEFERIWDGQYNFANQATREGLHARLLTELDAAIQRQPRNILNYYLRSQFHEKSGDYKGAAEVLERGWQAVKSRRGKLYLEHYLAYMRYNLGANLAKQKQYDEAFQVYESLVAAHPNAWYSRSALTQIAGLWQSHKNDYAKAVEAQQRFLRLYPDADECPGVVATLASLYQSHLKDPPKAIDAYRQYVDKYPDNDSSSAYLFSLASLCSQQPEGRGKAVAACRELLARYPNSSNAPSALSMLWGFYNALNQKDKAEEARAKLLKDYPYSPHAEQLETEEARKKERQTAAAAYSEAARLGQKDPPSAVAAYAKVVTGYPWTSYARTAQEQIIALWQQQKDADKELEARREFIRLFPADERCPTMQWQIGYKLAYQLDRVEEGVKELRRLIAAYPDSDQCVTAQYYIANAYTYSGTHYSREKYLAENQRLIDDYPWYDSVPGAQLSLALNYYYQFEPGDLERGRMELLKVVDKYSWSWSCASAEYYLDMLDAGMQVEENKLP